MEKNVINMDAAKQKMASMPRLMTFSDLENLPERLDDQMVIALQKVVNSPLPAPEPCDDKHFAQCLRLMAAVLPKQSKDEIDGKLFVAAYKRILQSHSREAISYLAEEAMSRCRWFPTIAECLEILQDYRRDDDAVRLRAAISSRLVQERRQRWEDESKERAKREPEIRRNQLTQDDVDKLPAHLVKLGLNIGALERDETGKVVPVEWEEIRYY